MSGWHREKFDINDCRPPLLPKSKTNGFRAPPANRTTLYEYQIRRAIPRLNLASQTLRTYKFRAPLFQFFVKTIFKTLRVILMRRAWQRKEASPRLLASPRPTEVRAVRASRCRPNSTRRVHYGTRTSLPRVFPYDLLYFSRANSKPFNPLQTWAEQPRELADPVVWN